MLGARQFDETGSDNLLKKVRSHTLKEFKKITDAQTAKRIADYLLEDGAVENESNWINNGDIDETISSVAEKIAKAKSISDSKNNSANELQSIIDRAKNNNGIDPITQTPLQQAESDLIELNIKLAKSDNDKKLALKEKANRLNERADKIERNGGNQSIIKSFRKQAEKASKEAEALGEKSQENQQTEGKQNAKKIRSNQRGGIEGGQVGEGGEKNRGGNVHQAEQESSSSGNGYASGQTEETRHISQELVDVFNKLGKQGISKAGEKLIKQRSDTDIITMVQSHWLDVLADVGYEKENKSDNPNGKVFIQC